MQRTAPLRVERNPDEIVVDDEDDENTAEAPAPGSSAPFGEAGGNPDEIVMDEEESDVVPPPEQPPEQPKAPVATTRFLALDKCLPRRQFLEVIDISPPLPGSEPSIPASTHSPPSPEERQPRPFPATEADAVALVDKELEWVLANVPKKLGAVGGSRNDPLPSTLISIGWLSRVFQPYLPTTRAQRPPLPKPHEAIRLLRKELIWARETIPKKLGAVGGSENTSENWEIKRCQTFVRTAPIEQHPGDGKSIPRGSQPPWYPQTKAFCEMLEIDDSVNNYQTGS